MECSSVQVERPRASTSGGQSRGIAKVAAAPVRAAPAAAAVGAAEDEVVPVGLMDDLAKALKAEPEEQVRQLVRRGQRDCPVTEEIGDRGGVKGWHSRLSVLSHDHARRQPGAGSGGGCGCAGGLGCVGCHSEYRNELLLACKRAKDWAHGRGNRPASVFKDWQLVESRITDLSSKHLRSAPARPADDILFFF